MIDYRAYVKDSRGRIVDVEEIRAHDDVGAWMSALTLRDSNLEVWCGDREVPVPAAGSDALECS
jgi:hypothetical protein